MGKFTKKVKKVLAYMLAGVYVLSKRMKRMIAIVLVEAIVATSVFVSYADESDDGVIVQMSVDEVEEMAAQQEESSESTDEGGSDEESYGSGEEEIVTDYAEPLSENGEDDQTAGEEETATPEASEIPADETLIGDDENIVAVLPQPEENPENKECICTDKCAADSFNSDCPVCSQAETAEDAEAFLTENCKGAEAAEEEIVEQKEAEVVEVDNSVQVTAVCEADGEAIEGSESFTIDVNGTVDVLAKAPVIEGYTFADKAALESGEAVTSIKKETTEEKEESDVDGEKVVTKITKTTSMSYSDGTEWKELTDDITIVFEYTKDETDEEETAAVKFTASFVDQDGNAIEGYESKTLTFENTLDLTKAPETIENYNYVEAKIDGKVVSSINKNIETDEEGEEVTSYSYTVAGTDVEVTEDTEVTLVYEAEVKEVEITLNIVDEEGLAIEGYADTVLPEFEDELVLDDPEKAPVAVEGYAFKEASIDGAVITALTKEATDETDSSEEAVYSYSFVTKAGESVAIEEDTEITLVYEEEDVVVAVDASIVDEFGDEIAEKYTGMDISKIFDDVDELVLDDPETPPVAKVQVRQSLFKVIKYTYVKATIDKEIITGLKREVTKDTAELKDKEKEYIYSYTTDGETWTKIKEDTTVIFEYSDGKKTVYTYEDSKVLVTATLQHANAIPDDAEFVVTPVTPSSSDYNYDAYMEALNENADLIGDSKESSDSDAKKYTEENTLLYDIAFLAAPVDENGETVEGELVEYQPAEGMVNISFVFKQSQLSEDLGAAEAKDVTVVHLPLEDSVKEETATTADATDISASDIKVEVVADSISLNGSTDQADFCLNDFSLVAMTVENNTPSFEKDWVKTEKGYYEFENVLTEADLAEIGGRDKIKLEYHYVDSVAETFEQSIYYDQSCALGVAGNFHIVAFGTATLGSHTNGNVLCNDLYAGSNFGTNNYKNEVSYIAGNYAQINATSASDSQNPLVVGNSNVLGTADNGNAISINGTKMDKPKVFYRDSATREYIDLDAVEEEISGISSDLAAKSSANISQSGNNYELTNPDGVGVINWKASEVPSGDINFTGFSAGHTGSIIINVDCGGGNVTLPERAYVYIDGKQQSTNEVTTFEAGKVIWNFTNCTESTITAKNMTGCIIALGATVNATQNLNGTIIAENVHNTAETHRTDFTGKTSGDSTEFSVSKSFTDNNWPDGTSYTFEFDGLNGAPTPENHRVTLTANSRGSSFGTIRFPYDSSKVGSTVSYEYEVKEIIPDTPVEGVTYDDTIYYVKVDVQYSHDEATAVSTARIISTSYKTSVDGEYQDFDRNSFVFAFENSYLDQGSIAVTKAINGTTDTRSFYFTLKDSNGNFVSRDDSTIFKITAGTTVTIENLPFDTYTLEETDASGNAVAYDGLNFPYTVTYTSQNITINQNNQNGAATITNTYKPEKIQISGSKTWDDGNNQDGTRPESITINLLANGTKVDSKTVSASDGWAWTFTNLDKYKDGVEIKYTVTEDEVKSYTTIVNGYDVTNSYIPKTVDISGQKTWSDSDNQDGIRPSSITVNLLKNGVKTDSKIVTSENNWAYEWKDLPKYENGVEITYTVTEDAVEGYSPVYSGYDIRNDHTPGKTTISVRKDWSDSNNQDGVRPSSIEVQLKADGVTEGDPVTLNEENNWSYTWTDLAEKKAGKVIEYTVEEVRVPDGYKVVVSGDAETGYILTNSHTPETTSISGAKTWDDNNNQDGVRPSSITINLLANGTKVDSKTVTANDNWEWTFGNLDKYANGELINYTIEELVVPGYTSNITGSASAGFTVINEHKPETTSISGTKTWDDDDDRDRVRPTQIIVNLLADGQKVDEKIVTVGEDGNWSWSFDNLPKYKNVNDKGVLIQYTVTENPVKDYSTEIKGSATDGFEIINTHTPGKTSISVEKVWVDSDNQDGKRPASIQVQLYADGEPSGATVTLDETNEWKHTWSGLLEKNAGTKISYTVKEVSVPGGYTVSYEPEGTKIIITNKHDTEKTSISGSKIWTDNDDQDGLRPDSITVHLFADGVDTTKTATATKNMIR